MLALASPGSDVKRYFRGRMPRLALLVILLMPLMYGALYLWAFWNPFAAADKIPVALINLDRGAEVMGEQLNAGDQVAQGLIESGQLDLHEVSKEDGDDGVRHGKYYFSITIPEDFSESVASAQTSDAHSAKLIFTYNDANNYLATIIGQDAAQQVVNQVNAQVGDQIMTMILKALGSAEGGLGEAASGSSQLASGAEQVNAGAQQLASGADELATNLVTAKDGSQELASSIDALTDAVDKVTAPMEQVATNDAREIAAATVRIRDGVDVVARDLDAAAGIQAAVLNDLDRIIADLRAAGGPFNNQVADDLARLQTLLATQGLPPDAPTTLNTIRSDADWLAAQLANPNSPAGQVFAVLAGGELAGDIAKVDTAAGELRSGADQLASGLVQLSDGANQLSSGASEMAANTPALASGADQLATALNEGIHSIPTWSEEQKQHLASTLSQPVQLDEQYENEAPTFGTGFAPFFFSLALFVGCILVWMLLTPLQARPIAQGLGSLRAVLASYLPTFGFSMGQAILLFAVVVFAIGLRPVHPIATLLFMFLVVGTFLAMIQMFNAVFGPAVGRVLTLAFLMVQLTSAGGIYPVPTTTLPFQYIHWVDPMTYTVNGLRQLTVGGVDHRLWIAIAVLVGLTVVFLAISTWAARRNRQYSMDRLYPPVEV